MAQQRSLLVVMTGHAHQHIPQGVDGVVDIGALVQHDAFGTLGQRRVTDLRPGRRAGPGELFEHLGRPDHRKMGGFAQPQDLLLDLGEPLEAAFDGQVAAGDHHAEADIDTLHADLLGGGGLQGAVQGGLSGVLVGRVAEASLPWAMAFPQSGDLQPRHPSQLYHVGLEGLALFAILWLFTAKARPRGAASGVFLIGYGVFRFITEYFREPDAGIFGQSYTISMGQWLSLPMILIGVGLLVFANWKKSL